MVALWLSGSWQNASAMLTVAPMPRARSSSVRKGGAPRKAPEGLDKVLFIRVNNELLDRLEELRRRRSDQQRGVVLSTADVARSILGEAIEREIDQETT